MGGDPTGDNARIMRKIGGDIQADAVKAHPAMQADTNGGNLILDTFWGVRSLHPKPDASVAAFGSDLEIGQGADQPVLEHANECSDVAAAAIQVQHDIGDPL